MSLPGDDWDDEERALLEEWHDELDIIRLRHAGDPPLDVLAAAEGEALPPAWQQRVQAHLEVSRWSRAVLAGAALPDEPLDAVTDARIHTQVMRATAGAAVRRRWRMPLMLGSAIAASALLAVFVWSRSSPQVQTTVAADRPAAAEQSGQTSPNKSDTDGGGPVSGGVISTGRMSPPPPPPPLGRFERPEFRLALSSMTWRGAEAENPYLAHLGPAVAAYRAGDFLAAAEAFAALRADYPDAFEVWFYGGISELTIHHGQTAVSSLEHAVDVADEDRRAEALWYLVAAQLRTDRAAERPIAFRARLDELCGMDGPWAARGCEAAAAWREHDAAVAAWRSRQTAPDRPE